jgi:hypothetical protein
MQRCRSAQQAGREHLARPVVDPLVECVTIRIQANAENIEASEWVAASLPETSHRGACANADFQRSHNLGNVIGVDCLGGSWVKAAQELMEMIWSAFCGALSQARAQRF